MSDATGDFWATIEQTRPSDPDPPAHGAALVETLVERGIEQTLAYGRSFDEAMAALYRWDLWGAAYYVLRGCGDDGFEYLRAWIVGQGQTSWRRAGSDPEGWFLDLLDGASDPGARIAELGLENGEPLLYAAGLAHERLTGSWLPPRAEGLPTEPAGEAWDEEELPALFPRLAVALPEGWWEAAAPGGADGPAGADGPDAWSLVLPPAVADAVDGVTAFTQGDHDRAMALLVPLFDEPEAWQQVSEAGLGTDAAYMIGIGRLMRGDPDGASEALRRALDPDDPRADIRRALAQVELARGELAAAADLLDRDPDAHRLDRALAVTLAFRRGDRGAARAAARGILADLPSAAEHPWDVAGALVQVGLVLIELRDEHHVTHAADRIDALIEDAPPTLPLLAHAMLVRAGALRVEGQRAEAEALLGDKLDALEGSDRGQALLELARLAASDGLPLLAAERYELAVEAFEGAGERWMAGLARSERDGGR